MEKSGETISIGVSGRVRERMWKMIERDTLSQKTQKQWADVSRTAATKLDARSLARVRMKLSENAEDIGKAVAIGTSVLNIVTGVALGSWGIADLWKISAGRNKAGDYSGIYINEQKRKNIRLGILKTTALPIFLGIRPFYYAGYVGAPLAERVAGIVNTIALQKESKQVPIQVFVGKGKA